MPRMDKQQHLRHLVVPHTQKFDAVISIRVIHLFFFFQAEDGIRDYKVTGVQTCALPISIAAGFRVEAVAGACALIAGLTASGLPTDEFHFIGFLPHKSGQRRNKLESLKAFEGTLVLYESPYRVEKLLGELCEVFPERHVVLARELTKKFEEYLRGKPAELLAMAQKRSLKGEFVVLVGPES